MLKNVKKLLERVSDAWGVPISTVKRIKGERKNIDCFQTINKLQPDILQAEGMVKDIDSSVANNSSSKLRLFICTPLKKKRAQDTPITQIDNFVKAVILRHIIMC